MWIVLCAGDYHDSTRSDFAVLVKQHARLFITTGILGGFTTFSTFSLEAALLWERGQTLAAFAYASASVVLSIGALFGGLWLIRTLVIRGIL